MRDSDGDGRPGVTVVNSVGGEQNITFVAVANQEPVAATDAEGNQVGALVEAGASATPAGFVVRFAGFLEPPAGADAVVIEIEADDLGVVLLDGTAVASADEEYARDFFRFDRAPSSTESIPIDGRTALQLIVADGPEAPYAWSFRFSFLADGQNILLPEAVGPRQFTSP